jgi:hypothetical protein
MDSLQKFSTPSRKAGGIALPSPGDQHSGQVGIPGQPRAEFRTPESLRPTNSEGGPAETLRGELSQDGTPSDQVMVLNSLQSIAQSLSRLADHFDPPPPDIVGTPYVANKLGCTTDWIAMLVRDGEIPVSCLVPGTGNGKPWKFRRSRIDEWIKNR